MRSIQYAKSLDGSLSGVKLFSIGMFLLLLFLYTEVRAGFTPTQKTYQYQIQYTVPKNITLHSDFLAGFCVVGCLPV